MASSFLSFKNRAVREPQGFRFEGIGMDPEGLPKGIGASRFGGGDLTGRRCGPGCCHLFAERPTGFQVGLPFISASSSSDDCSFAIPAAGEKGIRSLTSFGIMRTRRAQAASESARDPCDYPVLTPRSLLANCMRTCLMPLFPR